MRRFVFLFLLSGVLLGGGVAGWAQAPGSAADDKAAPAAVAPADQPSKEQLVKLFEVMRIRSQMETMLKMMPQAVQQQMKSEEQAMQAETPGGTGPTPEQKAAIDKVTARFTDRAFRLYPIDEMIDDMVSIYQKNLSRTDVEAITAFYESPAGQHLLERQPAMMKEVMPLTMSKMQDRAKALIAEYTKELKQAMDPSAPAGAAGSKAQPAPAKK